jgi:hypothetical protein
MLSHNLPLSVGITDKELYACVRNPKTWDKVQRLFDVYHDWCVLTGRVIQERAFQAFVYGQPTSYWDTLPPRTHTCLFNGWGTSR